MKKILSLIMLIGAVSFYLVITPSAYAKRFSCEKVNFKPLSKSAMAKMHINVNKKQILRRNNGAEPGSLDSALSNDVPSANILIDIIEPLFRFDMSNQPVPGVAKSWHVKRKSNGQYVYTFCLRKSYWSNGKPVKASDFVYAFRRAVNPATGATGGYLFGPILNVQDILKGTKKPSSIGVRAIGDNKLEITAVGAIPYYKALFAMPQFAPQYAPAIKKWGKQWTKPEHIITNGPFKLVKWIPNERIVLQKSKTYWDAKNIKLYQITYFPQSVAATAQRSYEMGAYDMLIYSSIPSTYLVYLKSHPKLRKQYFWNNQLGVYYYDINVGKKPVNNINLRKAMVLAYNHKQLLQDVMHGSNPPAFTFVPPGIGNYVSPSKAPQMRLSYKNASSCKVAGLKNHKGYVWIKDLNAKQSNALAVCYLKKAKYSKSNAPKLNIYYNTSEQHKLVAIVISNMWKETLGTKVSLVNEEWKVFLSERRQIGTIRGKSPIMTARDGWIGDYNDPYTFLSIFLPKSGNDNTGFDNPEYIKLINKSNRIKSLSKRAKVMAKAEQILLDHYAVIPIFYYTSKFMVKPYVKGFPRGKGKIGILGYIPSRYLWIDLKAKA